MKKLFSYLCCYLLSLCAHAQKELPVFNIPAENKTAGDWLITPSNKKAAIYQTPDAKNIVLYNGLVKRVFRVSPDIACIDYTNMRNGQQLLRSVKAEARLTIDGKDYNVGGLYGQKENAYFLPGWADGLKAGDSSFHFQSYEVTDIKPFLNWQTNMWVPTKKQATGKMLSFSYTSSLPNLQGIQVLIHYELYDGLPLICKWMSVTNKGNNQIHINKAVNEILGMVEEESAVVGGPDQMKKPSGIYIETNYAFNNAMRYDISDQTIHWKTDRAYTSQVNYDYQTPCLLEIYPDKAPGIDLKAGEVFNSVRSYELLFDSYDRERRGLSVRHMYRSITPWTSVNPIFMHLVSKNDEQVRTAIDQCVATGYEAVILSFGSHCNLEDTSKANILQWKALADYAHSKKIFIGGYSLFSSRTIGPDDDVIDPKTGKPGGAFFGNAPCLGSNWGLAYINKLKIFFQQTGFDIFENDGPYPGDVCASVTHPGHTGLNDSQWKQMELQKGLYHWCNEKGIYVNAPDWYFLDGTNKIGIGYREVNFSLPREQQMILNRQNIFDGTWEKTPAMGWGFVPLTRYQGGGEDAVLEPLSQHLKDYEQLMMQYYGAGVQACYRGPRLYDSDETRQTVVKVINWYKKYRDILNADILHLRRADGRDWDGILHVSTTLATKGMVMLYNPLKEAITRTVKLPLYYTGLTKTAKIREREGLSKAYPLNRDYTVDLRFTIAPESYTWFVIE
jgi:hypothetical protein